MRPNGRTGWVLADAVSRLYVVRTQLVIDRRALRARLYRRGELIWSAPVGIGAPATPTPRGDFWIRERLKGLGDGTSYGPWAVTVTGRQIRRVVFYLDGKAVRTLTRPNRGSRYVLAVRPNALRRGVHRIIARTTFTAASSTPSRSLRVVFSRCARAAGAPQFTG